MTRPWRRLALAAALFLTLATGVATAQTVTVRNLPPGAPVEVLFDGSVLVSGKGDNAGDAQLPITINLTTGNWESNLRIYVDVCGQTHKIGLVDRLSLTPTAAEGCERRDVAGLFVVKAATNLLVDVGGGRASVWLRQGDLPKEWLIGEGAVDDRPLRLRRPAPTGLALFGGASFTLFRSATTWDCGNTDCEPDNSALGYTAGATLWVTRWLALEGSYTKPSTLKVSGEGGTYNFNTTFESQFVTAVGKAGFPIGPFRPYGIAGANYHRSLHTTTQTNEQVSLTVDEVTTTFPGNTQTWSTATDGVGWLFGGGAEVWLSKRLALWGELTRAEVKGQGLDSTEGSIDERATFIWVGMRVRLGK